MDFSYKNIMFNKKKIKSIVRNAANETFFLHSIKVFDLSFLITNNKQIRKINAQFRNMDKPTDVLSFPSSDSFDGDGDGFFGDIIISISKVRSQAKAFSQSFERELMFLTIHGCLHLLGYDHILEKDEKIMREKQRQILNSILGESI